MVTEKLFWKESYEEKDLTSEIELESEKEKLDAKSSTYVHKEIAKKPVAFDFTYINNLLSNMETLEEKIKWLRKFKTQLQQSQKAMAFNSWNLATSRELENQHKSMTPYIQTISLAIREVQKKIRVLLEKRKRTKYRK
ncbi:MAG: hypothetical protein HWN66_04245 [Candidatus Helarchaeota archaeon]|nr:hypothetical protein [Candidatus Helarchaeota archaeon]